MKNSTNEASISVNTKTDSQKRIKRIEYIDVARAM